MIRRKSVIDFYEKEANSYEEKRFATNRGIYEDILQKEIIFEMVNSWRSLSILDLGCGTGRFSIQVSKWGGNVTALDPSLSMLNKVKRKMSIYDKIELVRGDAHKLPFKDGSFDGCICINVLSHLPSYEKAFVEIQRILRPNGFFIFNFPNLVSPLLPIGIIVNFRKKSLINSVYTKWYTLRKIKNDLQITGFKIETVKGVFLPAINLIPLRVKKRLDKLYRDSLLKYVSVGIFIKAIAMKR